MSTQKLEHNDDTLIGNVFMQSTILKIIDSMPNIIYLVDKNCTIQFANRLLLRMLGYKHLSELEEPLYTTLIKNCNWSEQRALLLKRHDIEAIVNGKALYNITEPPVVIENGDILYYSANRVPFYDSENQVIGMIVVLTDVTEFRRMQDELEMLRPTQAIKNITDKKEQTNLPPASGVFRPSSKPPKVLMIEDNEVAQKATQALLMQLDCQVDIAKSDEIATRLFKPGKYDLVFMDIGLGGTSGYVVSKKLRQIEKNTGFHVPIIALTGFEADVIKEDCNDYYMEGAITKPLTNETAKQIIQHYVYHINVPVKGLKTRTG